MSSVCAACTCGEIKNSELGFASMAWGARNLISAQVHAAQTLLKESGPKAFFRGWAWRTGRMVFQCFLFDACKNHLSPVFFPHHFRD